MSMRVPAKVTGMRARRPIGRGRSEGEWRVAAADDRAQQQVIKQLDRAGPSKDQAAAAACCWKPAGRSRRTPSAVSLVWSPGLSHKLRDRRLRQQMRSQYGDILFRRLISISRLNRNSAPGIANPLLGCLLIHLAENKILTSQALDSVVYPIRRDRNP